MKIFERNQIWLVNFDPSFGHEYKKIRPALIIQNDSYINCSNLLTVIPISSQTKKQTELDILIQKNSENRLMTDSLIKIKQISSFDKRRFIKFIGMANQKTINIVNKNLTCFLS